jgi:hypothetical protein
VLEERLEAAAPDGVISQNNGSHGAGIEG